METNFFYGYIFVTEYCIIKDKNNILRKKYDVKKLFFNKCSH